MDVNIEFPLALCRGSGFKNGKLRIMQMYQSGILDEAHLKNEYGTGGMSFTYSDGTRGFIEFSPRGFRLSWNGFKKCANFTWNHVLNAIANLITRGLYLTPDEQAEYERWVITGECWNRDRALDQPEDNEPEFQQITFDDITGGM